MFAALVVREAKRFLATSGNIVGAATAVSLQQLSQPAQPSELTENTVTPLVASAVLPSEEPPTKKQKFFDRLKTRRLRRQSASVNQQTDVHSQFQKLLDAGDRASHGLLLFNDTDFSLLKPLVSHTRLMMHRYC
jgi:hypothetical protein